ncbi:FecR family protein [Novosphingobium mangrovi (ex Huang et al. 2023)]|uniref:FecR domain-containing protein n=1 Tax=Novosphingobium mangrovi (ex Huang et al. 2023) TaxID=2976432 RepID=A0ABT2IAF7_9SPHN|nr:FecR domain-containing protein [Novosphingobium mangrovi (ex Huang et al. 2023)]MCT2401548.1 FecR domain-containing protein [Novosphingobium mangrovi (ex Huang et al. 2023)]
MLHGKARLAMGVAAMVAVLGTAPVDGQEVVGVNSAVRNDVKVRRDEKSEYRPAVVKAKVSLGNQVRTGSSSALQVTLLDKSNLTVGPNARFTVNRFVYDPRRKASSVGASVAKGTFRFMSGKAKKEGSNAVSTPAATIGIRGTIFEGAVGEDAMIAAGRQGLALPAKTDPQTATMVVLRGPGPNAQMGEHPGMIDVAAGGKVVTLDKPGQAVFVPYAGAAPIGPFQLNVPGYSTFDVVLRTAPSSFGTAIAALQGGTGGSVATGGPGGTRASSSVPKFRTNSWIVGSLGASLGAAGIIAATSGNSRNGSNGA